MIAIIVDGRAIANDIRENLRDKISENGSMPSLDIVVVGNNSVTTTFVRMKKRFAEEIGISFNVHTFAEHITTEELVENIKSIGEHTNGVVVQLPLPSHIDTGVVLNAIPLEKDIDVLSAHAYKAFVESDKANVPPVAGAVQTILDTYNISLNTRKVVIIGRGRLVGMPVGVMCERRGARVMYLDLQTKKDEFTTTIYEADIIISGAGSPNIVTVDMIREGVVLIDAGTSTRGGTTQGDMALNCSEKASLFSKTPGGVGPLTVAHLFKNLVASTHNL